MIRSLTVLACLLVFLPFSSFAITYQEIADNLPFDKTLWEYSQSGGTVPPNIFWSFSHFYKSYAGFYRIEPNRNILFMRHNYQLPNNWHPCHHTALSSMLLQKPPLGDSEGSYRIRWEWGGKLHSVLGYVFDDLGNLIAINHGTYFLSSYPQSSSNMICPDPYGNFVGDDDDECPNLNITIRGTLLPVRRGTARISGDWCD